MPFSDELPGPPTYPCPFCRANFARRHERSYHVQFCAIPRVYRCYRCPIRYTTYRALCIHLVDKHDLSPHIIYRPR